MLRTPTTQTSSSDPAELCNIRKLEKHPFPLRCAVVLLEAGGGLNEGGGARTMAFKYREINLCLGQGFYYLYLWLRNFRT